MNYALPNVYRKPYELYSGTLTCAMSGVMLAIQPLSLNMILPTMMVTASWGLYRVYKGLQIVKYRRNLRVLPYFAMSSADVPTSTTGLFIGRGFIWDRTHTQRLELARLPDNIALSRPTKLNAYFRQYELHHSNWITKLTRSGHWANPVAPLPPVGGGTEIHGIEPYEKDIYMPLSERVGHSLVLGTTRVGKTRLLEVLVTQDIARGDVVIVIDPKGDGELLRRCYAESKRAGREFIMFHLGHPKLSARYNPIGSYGRITEIATRIANQLPSDGQSAAFQQFVWRFVNVLSRTMESLGERPTYQSIYAAASNMDLLAFRYFEQYLNQNVPKWEQRFEDFEFSDKQAQQAEKQGRDAKSVKLATFMREHDYRNDLCDSLMSILSNDRSYFEKLVSSLFPLLEKLTTGQIADIISPDPSINDDRPIFDWMSVIQSRSVVYVGLDSLSDFEVATAVGNAMFSDLTSIAGQIYKYGQGFGESQATAQVKLAIHADEFNELIGDEFIPMLNKAGGAGYQVTVYTQTWSDIEAKIGSAPKAGQIGGNLNNLIMLRVQNQETAEFLTAKLPEVPIIRATQMSGASDIANPDAWEDFASRNEDRISVETVPMISPSDLVRLPKGQAFALFGGGDLHKIRMPMPVSDFEGIPEKIQDIVKMMQSKYEHIQNTEIRLTIEGESYANE